MNRTLETFFDKYGDMVYRVCLGYVKNREDAEDLAQDIFLKIQNQLKNFQHRSLLITWAYRITVNRCLDMMKENQRRNRLFLKNLCGFAEGYNQQHDDTCLTRLSLDKVLAETDNKTCKALFLSFAEGMSHEDIAEVLGVSRVAVSRRIMRFREKVQKKREYNGLYSLLSP